MEAATPTPITSRTLNDTTTQEYEQEEVPLESRTPLADEEEAGASVAATPTSLNADDTSGEYGQEVPLESQTPLADEGEVGVAVKLSADVNATLAKTLPKSVIIQSNSNNRYLHLYNENPAVPNALRFDGDYSFEPETRFEVVPASSGNGLIHIRCLRNNKYWVNSVRNWVTAVALEPEENQSDPHCTLFQPQFMHPGNNQELKLLHVRSGLYVSMFIGGGDNNRCLSLWVTDNLNAFTFLDWESIVVLPDLIRIKGDNGNYLRAWADGFMDYQVKADNSSLFDYEVSPSRNGGIRLKSVRFGTYWTDMNNYSSFLPEINNSVWVKLTEQSTATHHRNTIFLPTIVGGNRILMRSLRNNLFCIRHSRHNKKHCLAALNTYPDDISYMEIDEPVISRRITNVRYHLADARIHNQRTFALVTDEVSNRTQVPQTSEINIEREVTNTATWSTSFTFKAGMTVSIHRGVPLVKSFGFEISAEITTDRSWGGTETEKEKVGSKRGYDVPPMSRVGGRLMATRSSYDIPFSYTQRDQLANGNTITSERNDGLFAGVNGYGYEHDIGPLPLE